MFKKIGLGAFGFLLLASPVFAQSTDVQAQITALLAQIKALQEQLLQLQRQHALCVVLTQNLGPLYTDARTNGDVSNLQRFLMAQNLLNPNLPIGYFGPLTITAVQRWQAMHGVVASGDPDTTGYGFVGPKTRAAMAAECTMPNLSCTFNDQTIANSASVTAYQSATVPSGQQCVSEQRTCGNGSLSGTYQYSSCAAQSPAPCIFNGQIIASGASVTAYQSLSAIYGQSCQTQQRTCTNGALSGSYLFTSCAVPQAASCIFDGKTVTNGTSVTAYQSATVPSGQQCVSEQRTCGNGSLSGTYQNPSCTVAATPTPTNLSVVSVRPDGAPAAYSGAASLPYPSGSSVSLGSAGPDISADGRYVVFHSGALDLVPGTKEGGTHIFRRDLETGKTELVSVSEQGMQNDGYAYDPNVSADGRFVCFTHVPTPTDPLGYGYAAGIGQVLVKDMVTGALTLVTHQHGDSSRANVSGSSTYCWMSGDGANVGYISYANDLVPQTINDGHRHAYVTRISDGNTLLADISNGGLVGNGEVIDVALNNSGCVAVFSSDATNLTPKSTYGVRQVYAHQFCGSNAGTTRVVSYNYQADRPFVPGYSDGGRTPSGSENPAVSDDGNFVVFTSYSPDVVVQAHNPGRSDVFVANLNSHTFTQASVSSSGTHSLNAMSADPHISRNGRYVVFESASSNIVPGTTPGSGNSFIHDMQTGETKLLSYDENGQVLHLPESQYGWANGGAPRVANDGTTAFHTLVPLVSADINRMWDVYVVRPQ